MMKVDWSKGCGFKPLPNDVIAFKEYIRFHMSHLVTYLEFIFECQLSDKVNAVKSLIVFNSQLFKCVLCIKIYTCGRIEFFQDDPKSFSIPLIMVLTRHKRDVKS